MKLHHHHHHYHQHHHHHHHHPSPVRPYRPVSASSSSLFKGLPSRLRPFGLQFSSIFAILLRFILVSCRRQFYCIFLVSSWTGSALSSSNTCSFLLWSKCVYPAVKCNLTIQKHLFVLLTDGYRSVTVLCVKNARYGCPCALSIFATKIDMLTHSLP